MPSERRGMEMIAPSGKFWIAIPIESAIIPLNVIWVFPMRYPAQTTPTAIPSGILCNVTARTIIVVFWNLLFGPSALSLYWWICGITWSSKSKNNTPAQKPATAGTKENFPSFPDCSIDGSKRLQTEAATITPDAKPVSALCTCAFKFFFIKITQAAPTEVPKNGIRIP